MTRTKRYMINYMILSGLKVANYDIQMPFAGVCIRPTAA